MSWTEIGVIVSVIGVLVNLVGLFVTNKKVAEIRKYIDINSANIEASRISADGGVGIRGGSGGDGGTVAIGKIEPESVEQLGRIIEKHLNNDRS